MLKVQKVTKQLYLLLLLLLFAQLSFGQQVDKCGFDRMMERAELQNPDFERNRQQVEAFIKDYTNRAGDRSAAIVRIPTVIHVVHNGEPIGTYPNMSHAQIQSGIDNLNQAYRNTGIYSGTNFYNNPMDIEFVLAKVSPKGVATSGIERHNVAGKTYETPYFNYGIDSDPMDMVNSGGAPQAELFADFYWNPQDYMNIWIVKKIDGVDVGTGASGTLGYASFPVMNSGVEDGLVCQARAFGYLSMYDPMNPPAGFDFGTSTTSFQNGTANHEVGHYLSLLHTFTGDNGGDSCPVGAGDECADIPPHKRTNSICPGDNPTGNDCVSGGGPNDYIHNFMDYSSDECFQGFSANQKTRCEATVSVNGSRKALGTSIAADAVSGSFPGDVAATVDGPVTTMGIYDVTLNGVTFTSQSAYHDGGYLNRVASQPTVDLVLNTTYTMTVQVGVGAGGDNPELVNVYIDYNNDNSFNETDERVFQATTGKNNGDVFSFPISIPPSGPPTNQRIRMRIISAFDSGAFTGATVSDGQIEDYSVRFSAALPVELTNIWAKPLEKANQINWTTASEINNEGFEVQRSADSRTWETLGFVNGQGTSSIRNDYEWMDEKPLAGINYYRLLQRDFDGQFEYSKIVEVTRNDGATAFEIRPNPSNGQFQVDLPTFDFEKGGAKFELYDLNGRLLFTQPLTTRNEDINPLGLANGVYFARLVFNNQVITQKLTIQQ